MRFFGLAIIVCLAVAFAARSNFRSHQHVMELRWQAEERDQQNRDQFSQHARQTYPPNYPLERQDVHYNYNYPQVGVNDDASTDFDWPRMSMAIVMLLGGTLVCRRIFRNAPERTRPIQLQYRRGAPAVRPRPVVAPDRICSRADCSRLNPPMARFCRRCGAPLKDA
jgi:hypothetical protein